MACEVCAKHGGQRFGECEGCTPQVILDAIKAKSERMGQLNAIWAELHSKERWDWVLHNLEPNVREIERLRRASYISG